MSDPAFAGHAGDAGTPLVFPHEIMGAVAVLAIIGLLLIMLAVVGIWLLVRIDRRLKHSSQEIAGHHESGSSRPDA